ncbi:hypothetical protein KKG31_07050 [Patescibacteria group bacterium]|nr:hypothetical protein [Patescibacteria group bacterium]
MLLGVGIEVISARVGTVVSFMIVTVADVEDVFPAWSLAFAVKTFAHSFDNVTEIEKVELEFQLSTSVAQL